MSRTWSVRILQLEIVKREYMATGMDTPSRYSSLSYKGVFPLVVEGFENKEDVIDEVILRYPHHLGSHAFIFVMHPGMDPYELFRQQPHFYSKY